MSSWTSWPMTNWDIIGTPLHHPYVLLHIMKKKLVPLLICFSSAQRRDSQVFAMHKLDQTHCRARCIILLPFENKQDDATVRGDLRPSSPVPMYLCNSCWNIVTYETLVSVCIGKGYSRPWVYIQIVSLVDCKLQRWGFSHHFQSDQILFFLSTLPVCICYCWKSSCPGVSDIKHDEHMLPAPSCPGWSLESHLSQGDT